MSRSTSANGIKKCLLSHGSTSRRVTDELDDLTRVVCVLDGRPEPNHRQGTYAVVTEVQMARSAEATTTYFLMRWFKYGNAHVTFTRPDLVEKMDAILAKPPERRLFESPVDTPGRFRVGPHSPHFCDQHAARAACLC